MFDSELPEAAELGELSGVELIDAALGWARAENAACARKLAVMAEIFARRTGLPAGDRELWWIDPEAAVAAELAEQISSWGAKSAAKTEAAIDEMVNRHDPGALRRSRESASSRRVEFGAPTDSPGFTTMWARMFAADGAAMRERVDSLVHSVCEADPRSIDDRRNDAFAVIGAGLDTLACQCGTDDCEAAGSDRPGRDTTVYIVGDAATLEHATQPTPTEPEPGDTGDRNTDGPDADQPVDIDDSDPEGREGENSEPPRTARCEDPRLRPGWVFGAGIVPTPLLGGLIEGARIRRVIHPGDAPTEDRYTPSRGLADFIRCRDLTCRFPGCDKPATEADLDHTVPYPVGPTHASNMKCLCRFHHLLKTFWNGPDGWRDRQYPDGTIEWTSPTGHTYITHPGSRMLFPTLSRPTGTLWDSDPPTPTVCEGRGAIMPKRRRTRAQNRTRAIAAERKLNDEHVAEQNKPPPF